MGGQTGPFSRRSSFSLIMLDAPRTANLRLSVPEPGNPELKIASLGILIGLESWPFSAYGFPGLANDSGVRLLATVS